MNEQFESLVSEEVTEAVKCAFTYQCKFESLVSEEVTEASVKLCSAVLSLRVL